ncbi:MAG: branched-chain amino acid ABC transporter permease [Desulfobacterales bacterium]|nr:branched-chain amino acid ABC transporter permease [Desulfobacterales bacterium]
MDLSIIIQLIVLGLVRGSMYALMGVGLSLIFGIMEIVNFAHGELFMIGCYIMYFVVAILGLPFPVGIFASGIGLLIVGFILEKGLISTLRQKAGREWLMDSFVLTIGLMVIFQNLALIIFGSIQRGIPNLVTGQYVIGDVVFIYDHLVILSLALLTVGLLRYFVKHTNLGKAIRATSQHSEAAQTLGIDVGRMYAIAFGIGAALAGISGALLITLFPANPNAGMGPVLKSFVVVILGGLGNIKGAIAAGILVGLLEAYAVFFLAGGWQNVIVFSIVIVVLVFRPSGLFAPAGERP